MMVELLAGERQKGESEKAAVAFNDYARMGSGRSIRRLFDWYRRRIDSESTADSPPCKTLRTLFDWSTRFGWVERVAAYDAAIDEQKTAEAAQVRREIMEAGLALDQERVLRLKHLAKTLSDEIWSEDGSFIQDAIWLPDVKQIGGGETAERVDIVRFNRPILEEFRAILDDLAKETGGRRQGVDVDARIAANVKGYINVSPDDWDDDTTDTD